MNGPRVVFERPRFSKWGVRVSMSFLVAVLLWAMLSSSPLETRAIFGMFAALAAPFLLLVWFRVAQRIELDASGITIAGRLGARHYAWRDAANVRYPTVNWNDSAIATPGELSGVTPALVLEPPTLSATLSATPLQAAAYASVRGRVLFRLRDALIHIRSEAPDGDWRAQAAAVFAARDAIAPQTRGSVPTARLRE